MNECHVCMNCADWLNLILSSLRTTFLSNRLKLCITTNVLHFLSCLLDYCFQVIIFFYWRVYFKSQRRVSFLSCVYKYYIARQFCRHGMMWCLRSQGVGTYPWLVGVAVHSVTQRNKRNIRLTMITYKAVSSFQREQPPVTAVQCNENLKSTVIKALIVYRL